MNEGQSRAESTRRRVMNKQVQHQFCQAVIVVILTLTCGAWADTVLHNFSGSPADGAYSYSTPIYDQYGNLYGTTNTGGVYGYGTVWVMCAPGVSGPDLFPCTASLANWTQYVLYSFKGFPANDGANPYSTLVFNGLYAGRAFTLYGTTYNGGKTKC